MYLYTICINASQKKKRGLLKLHPRHGYLVSNNRKRAYCICIQERSNYPCRHRNASKRKVSSTPWHIYAINFTTSRQKKNRNENRVLAAAWNHVKKQASNPMQWNPSALNVVVVVCKIVAHQKLHVQYVMNMADMAWVTIVMIIFNWSQLWSCPSRDCYMKTSNPVNL